MDRCHASRCSISARTNRLNAGNNVGDETSRMHTGYSRESIVLQNWEVDRRPASNSQTRQSRKPAACQQSELGPGYDGSSVFGRVESVCQTPSFTQFPPFLIPAPILQTGPEAVCFYAVRPPVRAYVVQRIPSRLACRQFLVFLYRSKNSRQWKPSSQQSTNECYEWFLFWNSVHVWYYWFGKK